MYYRLGRAPHAWLTEVILVACTIAGPWQGTSGTMSNGAPEGMLGKEGASCAHESCGEARARVGGSSMEDGREYCRTCVYAYTRI